MTLFQRVAAGAVASMLAGASIASAAPVNRSSHVLLFPAALRGHRIAEPPGPLPPRVIITAADRARSRAAGWQRVTAAPPFSSAGQVLLLTTGQVLLHDNGSNWYTLTPDNTGSYINGTWAQVASLPSGYEPLYYASAVLPSGDVIINGGEYNNGQAVWTTLGAYYNVKFNTWTPVAPPPGWTTIGDAPSAVLANGTYMLGDCCSTAAALYDVGAGTWTATGSGKADSNNEEGWTLMPTGDLLTVDAQAEPGSEMYNPTSGMWTGAGPLPSDLVNSGELGPQMLLQNGTVFAAGADQYTALYHPPTQQWTAGPNFPIVGGQQLDIADGPATLLPNGHVIMATSPGVFQQPSYFLDFNGRTFTRIVGPPNAPNDSSYYYRLLLLPTGQVLETDFSNDVEIYSPGVKPNLAIRPVIKTVPTKLIHDLHYTATGVLFNGVSQANAYGDDAQSATNYPLIAIVNGSTGHVFYCKTFGFSAMPVASNATVSTNFAVPATIELGASTLYVIANGISSQPVSVTVR
jgi:hypothetical protein